MAAMSNDRKYTPPKDSAGTEDEVRKVADIRPCARIAELETENAKLRSMHALAERRWSIVLATERFHYRDRRKLLILVEELERAAKIDRTTSETLHHLAEATWLLYLENEELRRRITPDSPAEEE